MYIVSGLEDSRFNGLVGDKSSSLVGDKNYNYKKFLNSLNFWELVYSINLPPSKFWRKYPYGNSVHNF